MDTRCKALSVSARLSRTLAAVIVYGALVVVALWMGRAHAQDFLDPEQAFVLSVRIVDGKTLEATWKIADGYYLYHERLGLKIEGAGPTLGPLEIPRGKTKFDENFGHEVETHRGSVTVRAALSGVTGPFVVIGRSQGCADQGLCYPPQEQRTTVTTHAVSAPSSSAPAAASNRDLAATLGLGTRTDAPPVAAPVRSADAVAGPQPTASVPRPVERLTPEVDVLPAPNGASSTSAAPIGDADTPSEAGRIQRALESGSFLVIVPIFFAAGVLLSFTPCVLPMVPILASLIVGKQSGRHGVAGEGQTHHAVSRRRAFSLALTYSLGMALVYTLMGVAAGLAGEGLAAALQTPWVLGTFAAVLVVLSLSMFGVYELQVPAGLQARLAHWSNQQRGGSSIGVFIMGALSALIVGPCVAAPLAGTLIYISQKRDVWIGGAALFSMAVGMSMPLLLVGLSAGTLLPRAGAWMEEVKRFFGVVLIGVALWMVSPVIPAWLHIAAWATLLIACSAYLRAFESLPDQAGGGARLLRGVGLLCFIIGTIQWVGLATGGRDILQPLQHLAVARDAGGARAAERSAALVWQKVDSPEALDAALAGANGRVVMLDFYADWCTSCIEMERWTFTDARVAARLQTMLLLKADVTANTTAHRALLKRFSLFGPPGTLFFDASARELSGARVVGFESADDFLRTLGRVQEIAHAVTAGR